MSLFFTNFRRMFEGNSTNSSIMIGREFWYYKNKIEPCTSSVSQPNIHKYHIPPPTGCTLFLYCTQLLYVSNIYPGHLQGVTYLVPVYSCEHSVFMNSTHMNSTHMNSTHMNSTHMNSTHMNSTHMNSKHMNSTHMNSTHMNSTHMNSTHMKWLNDRLSNPV